MRLIHLFTEPHVRAAVSSAIDDAKRRYDRLTPQQRRIVEMIVDGEMNKSIAYKMGLSIRTVENHRAEIMLRLGATTLADVTRIILLAG